MWKFRDLPFHERRIYPTLTNFSVFPFLPLPMLKSVHVWPKLDNEVSTWFSWLHSIELVCEFLLLIHHCSTKKNWFSTSNLTDLQKEKKNKIMWDVVAWTCSANKLSWKFHKIYREIPVLESLSNTVKPVQVVRFASLLKRDPRTGVSKTAVRISSTK